MNNYKLKKHSANSQLCGYRGDDNDYTKTSDDSFSRSNSDYNPHSQTKTNDDKYQQDNQK